MLVVEFPPGRQSLTDRFFGTLGRIFKPGAGRGTGTAISGNSGRAGCDLRLLQFPTKTHGPPRKAIAQTFDAAIAFRDIIKAQLHRKVFIFPVLCFPDMVPDPIIEARAAEGHVTVFWGGDDLIGRMKELAKTQTIHRPPTAERIAQEVELIQPGMGHPAVECGHECFLH